MVIECLEPNKKENQMSTSILAESAESVAAATIAKKRGRFMRSCRVVFFKMPLFIYLLGIYVVAKLLVPDLRAEIFTLGTYTITWVEILYVLAFAAAMSEMLRVSHPGVNNNREATYMLMAFLVYFALFILAAGGSAPLQIFSNTEFLVLTLFSLIQTVMGFTLNSRTAMRALGIDNDHH
jgi:hypothetical protein